MMKPVGEVSINCLEIAVIVFPKASPRYRFNDEIERDFIRL